ncbi:MAG TPA: S46 family peptidase [Chitinophagaceae bacterium]|nr:S46 family peptidase [Chitinophagaceae bacterium]
MKKLLLLLSASILWFSAVQADEGMWIAKYIAQNIDEMQRLGAKLSAEDIYSINQASIKDAIVHFGGGCTAEMISKEGLLITNHHCGYGNIAGLSTVDNNYLENGFWAGSRKEEIHAPGLSVRFLKYMEDVTEEIENATDVRSKKRADKRKESIINEIETKASANGKYVAKVVPFYNGNQYILMVHEVYTDVRLVATPPKNLGKFGGDTDNWIWPRHTADFAIFRVYANAKNEPANYNSNNVPYQPKHYLPVSLKGVEEGDFAMIMGYPGRTNRYETSYGVKMAIEDVNPSLVKARDLRLKIMMAEMKKNPEVNLKLTSNYSRISNYWKYFIGQTEQLKRLKIVQEKRKQEKEFLDWANANSKKDAKILAEFEELHNDYRPIAKHVTYFSEAILGSDLVRLGYQSYDLGELLKKKRGNAAEIKKQMDALKSARDQIKKTAVPKIDEEILAKTAHLFYKEVSKSQHPSVFQDFIFEQFKGESAEESFDLFAKYVFRNSILVDDAKFEKFVKNPDYETLKNDPLITYAWSFTENYRNNFQPKTMEFNRKKSELSKQYIAALMKKNDGELFYPDANSTMRVTYGSVNGYSPKDGVWYDYYTTTDGLVDKYIPGDYEFDLFPNFLRLVEEGDFGEYANEEGKLVANFITNNDITGGNSGSPVINGNGELIGLAFDGNWEAMSGDIAFDHKYKKCIAVDIRFVLWLVDKYGNAKHLIEEMDIRK